MKKLLLASFVAAACSVGASAAFADPITSLYNTGVDSAGAVLPNATQGDPHYTLVDNANFANVAVLPLRVASSDYGYPITGAGASNWLADNTTSRWIAPLDPNHPSALYGPVGYFDYRTTFTLDGGLDPATASIVGQWAMDNYAVGILLNGVDTGNTFNNGYTRWSPFSITSGFQTGTNTLDFIVQNFSGPTGVRVEMTGTAFPVSSVPEPATYALVIAGLGAMGFIVRRRKQQD